MKHKRKTGAKLDARRRSFEVLPKVGMGKGFRRPGSMNRKKQA